MPAATEAPMAQNSIEISEEGGVRYLHFGSDWVQGAMRIQRPNALELPYTRDMMTGLLLRDAPWPKNALLIGLGSGSLAKYIYHSLPDTWVTVIEIDPQIKIIAHQHFKLPDDPARLRVIIGDGATYLLEDGEKFDYILVDGFDKSGSAGSLDKLSFYQACRGHLTDEGLLAVNLLGRSRGFQASAERIAKAFDGRSLVFPSCSSGNAIAFAAGGYPVDVTLDDLIRRANHVDSTTGLNLKPTIPRLQIDNKLIQDRLVI